MRNNFKDTWFLVKANFIDTYNLNNTKNFLSLDRANLIMILALFCSIFILMPTTFRFYEAIARIIFVTQGEEGLYMLLYLSIFIVSLSTIFTCMYKATSFLFSFKDFNMLASFPINTISILSSRMILLYVSNLFITIIVGFPAILVYGSFTNANIIYYLFAIILFLSFSIIPLIVGSIIAFIITKIATNFINTSFFMAIGSILVMVISFYLTSVSLDIVMEGSLYPLESLISFMHYYIPSKLFVNAITTQSFILFLLCIILNISLVVLFTYLFSGNFSRLNGILNETHKKSNYELKALSVSSQFMALYKKELNTYLSSHNYLINSSVGMIFLTLYSVYFLIFGTQDINWSTSFILAHLFVAMTCTTSVSFSIEGKSFYMLKVLPLKFSNIVLSKILLNLTVTVPLIILNSFLLAKAFNVDIFHFVVLLISLILISLIVSLNGIVINLIFPKLNFKSHVELLKRSVSSIIALITNIIIFAFITFINFSFSSIHTIILMLLISFMYLIFIIKKGKQLFEKM